MAEEAAASSAAVGEAAAGQGRMTMVVGVDESEHSYYALQWTLRHFFAAAAAGQPPQYRLVVVNAKPTAASAVGLAGPGTRGEETRQERFDVWFELGIVGSEWDLDCTELNI